MRSGGRRYGDRSGARDIRGALFEIGETIGNSSRVSNSRSKNLRDIRAKALYTGEDIVVREFYGYVLSIVPRLVSVFEDVTWR